MLVNKYYLVSSIFSNGVCEFSIRGLSEGIRFFNQFNAIIRNGNDREVTIYKLLNKKGFLFIDMDSRNSEKITLVNEIVVATSDAPFKFQEFIKKGYSFAGTSDFEMLIEWMVL